MGEEKISLKEYISRVRKNEVDLPPIKVNWSRGLCYDLYNIGSCGYYK